MPDERIVVAWVPGAFEIPIVADRLARSGRFAGVCCLGAVIQGETSHHEYINQQVSRSIMETAVSSGVPVLFGVLTCPSMESALERAGGKAGNKGNEAALAAIEMANLLKKLPAAETRTNVRGLNDDGAAEQSTRSRAADALQSTSIPTSPRARFAR